MAMTTVPDVVPVLGRGKHRNPRKGACFMEFASYLAGEPWSDHPACTHPMLAVLARAVNDHVSDAARAGLVPWVPRVVGLTGEDRTAELWLGRHCALSALLIAPDQRQRVLALAVLRCEAELAQLEGRPDGSLHPASEQGLRDVPGARRWAEAYLARGKGRLAGRTSIPVVVDNAVLGIAESLTPDHDDRLLTLLQTSVEHFEWRFLPRDPRTAPQSPGAAVH